MPPPILKRALRLTAWVIGYLVVTTALLVLHHKPILRGLSEAWFIEHDIKNADCAVVLGGGKPFGLRPPPNST